MDNNRIINNILKIRLSASFVLLVIVAERLVPREVHKILCPRIPRKLALGVGGVRPVRALLDRTEFEVFAA